MNKKSDQPARATADSLFDFVYSDLREQIRTRKLRPGDRLREIEIAERLEVSRTPVREAFKRLEADGLIAPSFPRGFVVVEMTQRQISDLYTLREVLLGLAARAAAEQAAPMEVEGMRQLVTRLSKAPSPEQASELSKQLGAAIVSAARNEYLTKAIDALDGVVQLLGPSTFTHPGRQANASKEHRATIEAIAKRDGAAAEENARQYARSSAATRFQMIFGEMPKKPR